MARYIDAERLINEISGNGGIFVYGPKAVTAIVSRINAQPTADVTEVRHGKWIHERYIDAVTSDYKCSVCDFDDTLYDNLVEKFYKYCPYCGAKMDLER